MRFLANPAEGWLPGAGEREEKEISASRVQNFIHSWISPTEESSGDGRGDSGTLQMYCTHLKKQLGW